LTVKVNVKTKGTFNLKNQVTKKGDAYKTQGEIKLWFLSGTQETDISILDLKIIKSKFIMMMELKD
jgi:hypothetical protein